MALALAPPCSRAHVEAISLAITAAYALSVNKRPPRADGRGNWGTRQYTTLVGLILITGPMVRGLLCGKIGSSWRMARLLRALINNSPYGPFMLLAALLSAGAIYGLHVEWTLNRSETPRAPPPENPYGSG